MVTLLFVLINLILLNTKVFACGISSIEPITDFRIVGGIEAKPHSWPWQVSLMGPGEEHMCGGTILDNRWILTAAHCARTAEIYGGSRIVKVRVGEHNLMPFVVEPNQKDYMILKYIYHHKFDLKSMDQDIMLVKLQKPIVYNDHVKPICLLTNDSQINNGEVCYSTGWGYNKAMKTLLGHEKDKNIGHQGNPVPVKKLQQTALPLFTTDTCKTPTMNSLPIKITDNMFCAGYEAGKSSICKGDSGGPLVCKSSDGKWLQYGVVSWAYGCAQPGYPSVFTKISNYIDWIQRMMKS